MLESTLMSESLCSTGAFLAVVGFFAGDLTGEACFKGVFDGDFLGETLRETGITSSSLLLLSSWAFF